MAQETMSLGDLEQIKGAPAPAAAPEYVQKLDSLGRAYATGKRKNAVARVWLKPGRGAIVVNDKDYTKYFARPVLLAHFGDLCDLRLDGLGKALDFDQ